jgi:hypothetical protein
MTSDLDGDDPEYDLSAGEKDRLEAQLRMSAREQLKSGKHKERRRTLARAVEISRRKSRRAHA